VNLTFFIHEWFLEIGHSNATIETIRNFPISEYEKIHIVGYELDDKLKLFPEIEKKIVFHKVPFCNIKPFLFKAIFFHIYTFFWTILHRDLGAKVSIGTATLICDYSIIQFVQKQWEPIFFSYRTYPLFVLIYKRIMYFYHYLCEIWLYKIKRVKVITVSNFLKDYFQKTYSYDDTEIITAYSATNLKRFSFTAGRKDKILEKLVRMYPNLVKLDFTKPVYLFVGAFERKGLKYILNEMSKKDMDYQFIIIGKPEQVSYISIPVNDKIVSIEFTRELNHFYSICDTFIFPTLYEPFGLVLMEASMMGMQIITTKQFVGASELLDNLDDIYLYDDVDNFKIPVLGKLNEEKRLVNINQRQIRMESLNWESTSKQIFTFIKENG
jgi:glycosyltransferase involved in cell wall biosynthesis